MEVTPATPVTLAAQPWQYMPQEWVAILGGDQVPTADSYAALDARTVNGVAENKTETLAVEVATAQLTGRGRGHWPGYWPPGSNGDTNRDFRCEKSDVLAADAARLPDSAIEAGVGGTRGVYVKVLVAAAGKCVRGDYSMAHPLIVYVYLQQSGNEWVPVRPWQIPASGGHLPSPGDAGMLAEWQLSYFSCGQTGDTRQRDRIVVVEAFDSMCLDAADDGVNLQVDSGYRTRAEQAELFDAATEMYGGEVAARQWVAYADGAVCYSRHCSGMAVNVAPSDEAITWLTATAGCLRDGAITLADTCPDGWQPVPRMLRYGFTGPVPGLPGYLEFALPVGPSKAGHAGTVAPADCSPTAVSVPNQVASIFRCRLSRAGIHGERQDTIVAQALTVSRCESGWNSTAKAYGGKFTSEPNPVDGLLYTQQGVFMLPRALVDAGWAPGGTGRLDPIKNINAAASVWLADRGWGLFRCATGPASGFENGPVLPEYGGPELPTWAWDY